LWGSGVREEKRVVEDLCGGETDLKKILNFKGINHEPKTHHL